MGYFDMKDDERLSPRTNRVLNRISWIIWAIIFFGPLLGVMLRSH